MKNINFINSNNNNNPQFPPDDVDVDDDDDVEVDDDDVDEDSVSSADPIVHHVPPYLPPHPPLPVTSSSAAGKVTIALPNPDHRLQDVTIAAAGGTTVVEDKKPFPIDDSRKLFQRLWTDEDEMELLQGFLEYTKQRGRTNNSSHHHDTTAFYDQIKCRLQLDFNKNQLVEKLRRLKKKYRNITQKMSFGKEYVFKSPHDQATYEISKKIWGGIGGAAIPAFRSGGGGGSAPPNDGGLLDDNPSPNPNPTQNPCYNYALIGYSPSLDGIDDRKIQIGSRKRSRGGEMNTAPELTQQQQQQPVAVNVATGTATTTSTNVIEETVRSCLSPVFKELLQTVMNLNNGPQGLGGLASSPMPLGPGFVIAGMDVADERWRKQQILELEVFLKRLELVQDQIKAQLEELKGKKS